jgi:hypothetical protein
MADEKDRQPLWSRLTTVHPDTVNFALLILIPQLAEVRFDLRESSAWELENIVDTCCDVRVLGEVEKRFAEAARSFNDSAKPGDAPSYAVIKLAQLANRAASRKNALARAGTDGLLLDEKPKPPKGGAMFQTARKALAYG